MLTKEFTVKKISLIVGLLALVFSLSACGDAASDNSPESVALRFMNHIGKAEFNKAAELGTDGTKQMLSFFAMMAESMDEADLQEEIGAPGSFTVVSSEVSGDIAMVVLEAEGEQNPLTLKKVDGQWLVDLDKEGMDKEM